MLEVHPRMSCKKYISTLALMAFLFTLLITGCAKDELIPPAGDATLNKTMGTDEVKGDDFHSLDVTRGLEDDDSGGITDDEDDEDDSDRSVN
ncbi:MAG: hypothetical protein HKO93_06485 [Flavobacteriales bacterium]|nr:hypothetical protein [Flavobacteriales bacterium]